MPLSSSATANRGPRQPVTTTVVAIQNANLLALMMSGTALPNESRDIIVYKISRQSMKGLAVKWYRLAPASTSDLKLMLKVFIENYTVNIYTSTTIDAL
ncbi:hypothetical protein L484_025919 [Morus notabilis]|uniref:Uncharacterized protein n=1 Tax=Morus notabilis TaxID=981085 RepID=W9RW56_9ROSA|nr:hypothetical protein L484_025919 [Morus notabilis]